MLGMMRSAMAIWANGYCVLDRVLSTRLKRSSVMNLKERSSVASNERCVLMTLFANSICSLERFYYYVGVSTKGGRCNYHSFRSCWGIQKSLLSFFI